MESVHGVDVSWLHRPHKDSGRPRAPSSPAPRTREVADAKNARISSPAVPSTPRTPKDQNGEGEHLTLSRVSTAPAPLPSPTPTSGGQMPATTTTTAEVSSGSKSSSKRDKNPRRASWISNISSRFSSTTSSPNTSSPASPQVSKPIVNGSHASSPQPDFERHAMHSPPLTRRDSDELHPYIPQKPKESGNSFFSSITKRLAPTPVNGYTRADNGGVCPRRTMNVNPNRARCLVAELDHSKLRRVSFSVDVEIASVPKYKDDEPVVDKAKKTKDRKIKERAEGEALKHPVAATELKDDADSTRSSVESAIVDASSPEAEDEKVDEKDSKHLTRKQEKKKNKEEERKERKEKKRKKAEENGTLPVEMKGDPDDRDLSRPRSGTSTSTHTPKSNDRPTTDPVRVYRRCCQLRESPILKRITEQLSSPRCTEPGDSGTVTCLNLNGSRLQLADFVTLGDWLAIVPVRRLQLEDADITDEGLRVVLAGLLAAKKPEPTRKGGRGSGSIVKHNTGPERAGVVERIVLKNNPRVTRIGWKYIAVFLNMCRSLKAIDLSMITFPDELPAGVASKKPSQDQQVLSTDAAEIFSKALAERLGGQKLEELIMSECSLKAAQIRRVLDGAVISAISRIGLAGNHLDDEGFDHILEYLRSGVCHAIDIGSNEMSQQHVTKLADALIHKPDNPIWGVSLASCNLDTEALRILFPALIKLKDLRFLDISHNRRLFENDNIDTVHLLRKYLPLMQHIKRLHINDVGINAKQTIGIAEVFPEGPTLAHVSLLDNAELSKLVANTDEASQEEACALYASLMAAVRVSTTIICVDIDVPAPDNSEVVKALAKQVVAYCLRNMERLPLTEAGVNAATEITKPHTEENGKRITYPEVLIHLVGHADDATSNNDNGIDEPAPDDDYIVGGTGVVKALQYCLGEAKAQEIQRKNSNFTTPPSNNSPAPGTPTTQDRDQQAGREIERRGKAKDMSKNLLGSARKIRERLQPALIKESATGDEIAYRRLMFLDQTLQGMIQRFEDEFPECRLNKAPKEGVDPLVSPLSSTTLSHAGPSSIATMSGSPAATTSVIADLDSDDDIAMAARPSRRGSEVSIASRALGQEEGRMHRLGHGLRQDIMAASTSPVGGQSPSRRNSGTTTETKTDGTDASSFTDDVPAPTALDEEHLAELSERIERLTGSELRSLYEESGSWDAAIAKLGASMQELRILQERDPHGWDRFVESQIAAKINKEMGSALVTTP